MNSPASGKIFLTGKCDWRCDPSMKDEVEVLGMAPVEECESEVFVMMQWDRPEGLAVPLEQLKPISHSAEQTKQAVADWHYWRSMRYEY